MSDYGYIPVSDEVIDQIAGHLVDQEYGIVIKHGPLTYEEMVRLHSVIAGDEEWDDDEDDDESF